MRSEHFNAVVRTALAATPTSHLLLSHDAVILERIARGGGTTNWYYCQTRADLDALERALAPGSVVSFYFDGRIRRAPDSSVFRADVEKIIAVTGDAMVGALTPGGILIDARIVSGPSDLADELTDLRATMFFYGAFPARDNDGVRAVTVQIPDEDGIVRAHPH
jgi:hypothetical protein